MAQHRRTTRPTRPEGRRGGRVAVLGTVLLTVAVVAVGVAVARPGVVGRAEPRAEPAAAGPATTDGASPADAPPDSASSADAPAGGAAPGATAGSAADPSSCVAMVADMSPRARVGQRLMVGADAGDPAGTVELVAAQPVGGLFLGGNDTALLRDDALAAVQAASAVPVAVAVDDEGGRVQRIDDLDGELPSARRMAAELTPEETEALGRERGEQLAARGVTMNLAPTVDVGEQPRTAVIGDRSFGADPDVVTRYAGAFAAGQRAAGLYTVLKHFPGHGRADGDSHVGRVSTPPLDELRATDLRPYADLLGTGGPLGDGRTGVMLGHLDVPGLTDDLPTSLSPAAYDLLRTDYGFDGLGYMVATHQN